MPSYVDARQHALGLVGAVLRTPAQGRMNRILSVDRQNVMVETERSGRGEPVALRHLQRGLDKLLDEGEVRIAPETFGGYRRSAALGAMIGALDRVEVDGPPTRIRLASKAPLREGLEQACRQITEPRISERVSSDDPFYGAFVRELPRTLRAARFHSDSYKVQGSAGQMNFPWAETAWVAVFDRLVTESAQQGHYVVYLVHPEGKGVYLSLNQGVTEARSAGGGKLTERLADEAGRLRGLIPPQSLTDLITEPLDLSGKGDRTRGYEAASVAARFYPRGELPHDAALLAELNRFLNLYEQATAGIDQSEAAADPNTPPLARPQAGKESRRYRWHLRAEGRNSRLAQLAKAIQGYRCEVCGRDFVEELGPVGKRCVDAHHLTPFSDLNERPVALDPASDFAIVCANCHRLIHSETPPLLPAEAACLLAVH
ncbi:MAG TPA: DUF3578 domain-containing protein [Solirubrobacterales bacterium]|nr:DUF3578 domain-containing protein [Solirubrobacterales bacterium]